MTAVVIGAALGLVLVRWLGRRSATGERRGYALALVIAAAIYLGFAFGSLDAAWLLVEAAGLVLFSLAAWLGVIRSAWWLSVGWLTHVAWDLALHGGGAPMFVPAWYPLLCAGFDPVVAAAIVWRMRHWDARSTAHQGDDVPTGSRTGGAARRS